MANERGGAMAKEQNQKQALEAAGEIVGAEIAEQRVDLDWTKWNEARKKGRTGRTHNVATPAGRATARTVARRGQPGHDPHAAMVRDAVQRATGVDTSTVTRTTQGLVAGRGPAWMGNRTAEKMHRDAVVAETETISNEWSGAKASGDHAAQVQIAQRLQSVMEREFNAEAGEDPLTGPMTNSAAAKLTGWGGITIMTRNCIAKAMRATNDAKPGYGGDPMLLARRVQFGLEEARLASSQGDAKKAAGAMVQATAYRRAMRESSMARAGQAAAVSSTLQTRLERAAVPRRARTPRATATTAPAPASDTWDKLTGGLRRPPLKDEINLAMQEFKMANGFEKNEQGELVPVIDDPWTEQDDAALEAEIDAKMAADAAKLDGHSSAPHDSKPHGV